MDFNDTKSISRQVEQYCWTQIMSGAWQSETRIPSTKDLALQLGVNPRTVMKVYDSLSEQHAIYQRRGMGYYVAPDASEQYRNTLVSQFIHDILPDVARRIRELHISPQMVIDELNRLLSKQPTE